MSPKLPSSRTASAYATKAFSGLAQVQALALKIESTAPFEFSEEARAALKECEGSFAGEKIDHACDLAASELEGSAALAEVVKTLSLAIALPALGKGGAASVLYPGLGSALTGDAEFGAALREPLAEMADAGPSRWPLVEGFAKAAPGALWFLRSAQEAMEMEPEDSEEPRRYLSASWEAIAKSKETREMTRAAPVSRASQEDNQQGSRRPDGDFEMPLLTSRRVARDRVLAAQRALMAGLEGGAAGEPGLLERAAKLWGSKAERAARSRHELRWGSSAKREQKPEPPLPGVERLLDLGDRCLMAALELASQREAAALESMGLAGAAERARADAALGLPSLAELESAQERSETLKQADAMARAFGICVNRRAEGVSRDAAHQQAIREHAERSSSKKEMELFFKSEAGHAYAEALALLPAPFEKADQYDPRREAKEVNRVQHIVLLHQAFLQEFREPCPGGPLSGRSLSEIAKKGLADFLSRELNDEEISKVKQVHYPQVVKVSVESWRRLIQEMGAESGVAFLRDRCAAAQEQCPRAARWFLHQALGFPVADPEPIWAPIQKIEQAKVLLDCLPYGHAADGRLSEELSLSVNDDSLFADPAVAKILRAEGFAGRAALAAKRFYGEIETRPGANERSRANAWLAAGKRLCKEELGLTEAAYQAGRAHEGVGEELTPLLSIVVAEMKQEAERRIKNREEMGAARQRSKRLGELLAAGARRSLPADRAFVASLAGSYGRASGGDLMMSAPYLRKAFEPMGAGVSKTEAFETLACELKAREKLRERFDMAVLERSDELLKALAKEGRSGQEAEKAAAQALKAELERVDDWADDQAGVFFRQLPEKLSWIHLRRGEEAWHQEALTRAASSGAGWEPALGSWRDDSGDWVAEELLTPEALSQEGKAMRHCVGTYSDKCRDGGSRIFSIKRNGVRELTAQFESSSAQSKDGRLDEIPTVWSLKQNKGPCNADPTLEGAAIVERLGEALKAGWAARLAKAAAAHPAEKACAVAASADFEVPGFSPDRALDFSKLRARLSPRGEAQPASAAPSA